MNIIKKELDFTSKQLPELFTNIHLIEDSEFVSRYTVKGPGGDKGDITVMGENRRDYRYFVDNYPGQKKFYATNIPYRNLGEFVEDMRRVGLPLEPSALCLE